MILEENYISSRNIRAERTVTKKSIIKAIVNVKDNHIFLRKEKRR